MKSFVYVSTCTKLDLMPLCNVNWQLQRPNALPTSKSDCAYECCERYSAVHACSSGVTIAGAKIPRNQTAFGT
jgi:hypothetical protein